MFEKRKNDIVGTLKNGTAMIGLKNGVVVVSDYDPCWISEFEKEKALIQKAIPGSALIIEHMIYF